MASVDQVVWCLPDNLVFICFHYILSAMARLSKRSTRKPRKPSRRKQRSRTHMSHSKRRKTKRNSLKKSHKGGAEWIDKSRIDPYALPGHQVKTLNGTAPTGMCRNASGQLYSCPEFDPTNRF